MANDFQETATSLREAAESREPLTEEQREDLREAADILSRLDQLKCDLIRSAPKAGHNNDDGLARELMNLLGI